jgi:hypothetical protein
MRNAECGVNKAEGRGQKASAGGMISNRGASDQRGREGGRKHKTGNRKQGTPFHSRSITEPVAFFRVPTNP